MTLAEALERATLDKSTGIRLLDRREQESWLSWSALRSGALRVGAGLQAHGVEPGDRVALIYPTGRELLEAFFGAVEAGAIPCCLPPPPRFGSANGFGDRVRTMAGAAGARLVLTDSGMKKRVLKAGAGESVACRTLDELPTGGSCSGVSATADSPAMIQFSSGTTLAPKPVVLSHASVLGQARLLNSFWPDSKSVRHRGLSWLPLHHDMGLIGCVFVALERPGELTLMPPELFAARPAAWLRAISSFGATVSPATNFAYSYCVERIRDTEIEGVDLSRWRVALNGAEPVSAAVMRRFAERFSPWGFKASALTPVYGLAEASLAVTFSGVDRPFVSRCFARERLGPGDRVLEDPAGRELVSVGGPVAGFEISIRDSGGVELEDGTIGRIWASGPTLMSGYLGRETATREVLRNGWLDTGDLGFVHQEELFVCGRAKDLIIVRGRNHSPVEIEQSAESVPGVQAGGAVAVGHLAENGDQEQIVVLVERSRRARSADVDAIPEGCREAVLAATGLEVDRVVVLAPETIARTSSGKVRRAETLRRFLEPESGRA